MLSVQARPIQSVFHVSERGTAWYVEGMQPRDAALLIQVARAEPGWTIRRLAERGGQPVGSIHRGLRRLAAVGLYEPQRRAINLVVLDEFFRHGARFLLGAELGSLQRGIPTAWGVSPLSGMISSDDPPPVWPSAIGTVRGPAIDPLVANIDTLGELWPEVATDLSLVDAIRVGDARARALATDLLMERLSMAITS